jgi:hypothetical protein
MIPLCARERQAQLERKRGKEQSGATATFVLTWPAILLVPMLLPPTSCRHVKFAGPEEPAGLTFPPDLQSGTLPGQPSQQWQEVVGLVGAYRRVRFVDARRTQTGW